MPPPIATVLLRSGTAEGSSDIARSSAIVRDQIGDAAYQAAFERGATLTHDQALDAFDVRPSAAGA